MKGAGGDGQTAAIGTVLPVPLVILVTDAEGRPVPGVSVEWEARGGGSVSATSVKTNSKGHATVERTLGGTVGEHTTVATADGLAGSPVTFKATARAAGSEAMAITVQAPTSVLDEEVFAPTEQPAVKILDPDGDPIAAREVTVTVSSGNGEVRGTATAVTNGSGVATFTDLGIDGTGSHKLKFANGSLAVETSTITVSALPSAASTGKWSPVITWPIVPLHMHLLPNGNILAWGREDQPHVWTPPANGDPAGAGSFVEVRVPDMLFCSGHAFMPDGRLLVSGGHLADDRGLAVTYLFTANGNGGSWSNANGALMARGRWYPTVTILPDGRALTMAGRDAESDVVAEPEIWNGSAWLSLSNADRNFPYYPRNFVASNGRVFYAGEQIQSRWLNVATGAWTTGPAHLWQFNRDYGSAVMYDDDKIMYVGGGGDPETNSSQATNDPKSSAPTNTAEIIDLGDATPTRRYTDPMEFARRHLTATVLPTREVLVTGGVSSGGELNNLSSPTRAAEIWNPATGTWRTLASAARPRGYHAVSLLMPSGLVLHGASGDANRLDGSLYPRENNHEMFSPPYLFRGNRPTITSAPNHVDYGAAFDVQTPYGAQITRVTWIRLPSVTHAFDSNQRLNTLSFTRTGSGIRVTAPSSGAKAPPGHYMLFIMNRNGVPSVGHIIRIG
jgi:galactose oxidase